MCARPRLSVIPAEAGAFDGQTGSPRPVERFADGTLLVQTGNSFTSNEVSSGARRDSVLFYHSSADGARLNAVMGLRGTEAFIKTDGQSMSVATLSFGRSSSCSRSGERIFAGDNDTYEIRAYSPDGKLERPIRRSAEVRPVTAADVDQVKRQRLGNIDSPGFRKEMEGMLAAMPIPATMPAFAEFRADAAGNLWVKEYPGANVDAASTWTVFDPAGRMLGELSTPPRFQVIQIGDDFVLGVWKDDLDVEQVRLYALAKPG